MLNVQPLDTIHYCTVIFGLFIFGSLSLFFSWTVNIGSRPHYFYFLFLLCKENRFILFLFFFWFCRFDGIGFLSKWRGKKIMFVGDSLSLNMWESLSCMIRASVPSAKNSFVRKELQSSVTFQVRSILLSFFLFQNEINSIK